LHRSLSNDRQYLAQCHLEFRALGRDCRTDGSCVFLVDQEQKRFRFSGAQHSPRAVWWTRQLPGSRLLSCGVLLALLASTSAWRIVVGSVDGSSPLLAQLNLVILGLKFAMVAFAAGQWTSMMVRSGLLSGFFGLLLGTMLCGWVLRMEAMHLSWLWTVLPIPLVLLWATWLRAPDWVRENTQWSARFRATGVVVIPALTLMVAVPYYRVHEIPVV